VQLKTILNSLQKHKSFVYQLARWSDPEFKNEIEIPIQPRANSRAICSKCGKPAPGYDQLPERRFEFVPLWQIAIYFVYAMRRVDCPTCGVKVEQVPWCDGKDRTTKTFLRFFRMLGKRRSGELEFVCRRHVETVFESDCQKGGPSDPRTRSMRSQLEPMKKVVRTLRNHRQLLLNWFRAEGRLSSGVVEGFNTKVKLTTRKSYGLRTYEAIESEPISQPRRPTRARIHPQILVRRPR